MRLKVKLGRALPTKQKILDFLEFLELERKSVSEALKDVDFEIFQKLKQNATPYRNDTP